MSLILDALNRADQERSTENSSPGIQTSHSPAPVSSKPIRRWLIEATIIGLALAAFIYSQWFGQTTPLPAANPANKEPAIAAESVAPMATIERNPPVKQQPVIIPTSNDPQADNTAIASLYRQQPVTPVRNNSRQASKPPPKPLSEVDNTQAILLQIPLLSELPVRFQRAVPTINYEIHVYSENDKAGFVKVNGAIRKIGAEIEPGLRVVAILKDSLVLDYNDTQFRLTALNSWMNFK